jgi:hypothetical protein
VVSALGSGLAVDRGARPAGHRGQAGVDTRGVDAAEDPLA